MKFSLSRLLQFVLRGYGQLFLANGVVPGALIFWGLFVLNPVDALRSFLCAGIVTAWAMWRASDSLVETGLYGVNGVLFGLMWRIFPELSERQTTLFALCGSLAMAAAMVPCARFIKKKEWPFALFSLPYVVGAWLITALMFSAGVYERHQLQGWMELSANHPEAAAEYFSAVNAPDRRAEGLRQNGLGWAHYRLGKYEAAHAHFSNSTLVVGDFADSYAGLGWSSFKMGRFEQAEHIFGSSVYLDANSADAWDGLGWASLCNGKIEIAESCFVRALRVAPLLGDAWAGRSACAGKWADGEAQRVFAARAAFVAAYVPAQFQRASESQWLCWVLFLIAIMVHSRTSFMVVVAGLSLAGLMGRFVPMLQSALGDIGFVMNLAALYLALGGQYMRLNLLGVAYMLVMTFAMAFAWGIFASALLPLGLPQLGICFDVALIGTLVLFQILRGVGIDLGQTIPMEVAVKSPEAVRLYLSKIRIVKRAWGMIEGRESSGI